MRIHRGGVRRSIAGLAIVGALSTTVAVPAVDARGATNTAQKLERRVKV
ncbi:MAG: hypothetical protein WA964_07965 [Ilumatobacter sp.]